MGHNTKNKGAYLPLEAGPAPCPARAMAFLAVAGATRIGREPQVTPVMVDSACWGE